jgi:hypothetical protein
LRPTGQYLAGPGFTCIDPANTFDPHNDESGVGFVEFKARGHERVTPFCLRASQQKITVII